MSIKEVAETITSDRIDRGKRIHVANPDKSIEKP